MRRAVAMVAALALGACQVDVEGAQCQVPGAVEDCPSGQACGNDRRCSERALACATSGTRCEVGTALCAGNDDKARVERCSGDVDPACGAWVVDDCDGAGLECGTRSGTAACECPAYAVDSLVADPAGGSPAGAAPFPTGAPTPAVCRFRRLGDALEAARILAEAGHHPVVQADGAAYAEVVFGDAATEEVFPLAVAPNVALTGAPPPVGPTVVRAERATDETRTRTLVEVQGTVALLRIESVPTSPAGGAPVGATGTGIAARCGATGAQAPRIEDVAVDGGGTLTTGIDVAAGACGATLSGLDVSRVNGPALSTVADVAVEVRVTASRFRDSAVGIRAEGGKLTVGSADVPLDAVEVRGNTGEGIVLTGGPTPPFRTLDVELLGARIEGNGGTGLVLDSVSTASKLAVRGCVVYANGGASPTTYGPDGAKRTAGGALIRQDALPAGGFAFEANRLSSNAADQLGFETSGAWTIAPVARTCGSSSNLFACVGVGNAAVGVTGPGGGTVNASYSVWPGLWNGYASPGVFIDSQSAYCTGGAGGAPVPPATCPAP